MGGHGPEQLVGGPPGPLRGQVELREQARQEPDDQDRRTVRIEIGAEPAPVPAGGEDRAQTAGPGLVVGR